MTPDEAADFLNVSRPYLLTLIADGVLQVRMISAEQRIPLADLETYKHAQRARGRAAIDEMVRLSEEMGLYGDHRPMPSKSSYRKSSDRRAWLTEEAPQDVVEAVRAGHGSAPRRP